MVVLDRVSVSLVAADAIEGGVGGTIKLDTVDWTLDAESSEIRVLLFCSSVAIIDMIDF